MCDIVSLFMNTYCIKFINSFGKEDFHDGYLLCLKIYFLSYAFKLVHIAEYSVFGYKADFLFTVWEDWKEFKLIYK